MRAEALRQLRDLRWLEETERHRDELLLEAAADPTNKALRALLYRLDEVITHEWRRLNPPQRSILTPSANRMAA
jgi:hypothetical protein